MNPPDYNAVFTFVLAGAALIYLVAKRPVERKPHTGWLAFLLLGVPMVGMVLAGASGNQTLVWVFGIACMLAVPLWLFVTILLWVASLFQGGGNKKR